jgi:hypothetical protein
MATKIEDQRAPKQLHFAWIPMDFEHDCWQKRLPSRRATRSRIRPLEWPPRRGQKIAFRGDFGIGIGVLREIRLGLACRMYIMADGKIAMEHELVMRPEITRWRDPDTVSEQEFAACVERINSAHNAEPERDPRELPELWADFCQLLKHLGLKREKEREQQMLALMQRKPSIPVV